MTSTLQDLRDRQEMAWHNVWCYSANCLMSEPKKGFEKEWKEEKRKALDLDFEIEREERHLKIYFD